MKILKAQTDFSLNGFYYTKGDEIENVSFDDILKMNRLGYIEPLTVKDLQTIRIELTNKVKKGGRE